MNMLPHLTPQELFSAAKAFCKEQSLISHNQLLRVTDGKTVGTYIEHLFLSMLSRNYEYQRGNSAYGIDIPDPDVMTDIKATLLSQPQSSSPFRNADQKVYGLGYNLLLCVYQKEDTPEECRLHFAHCVFISAARTADYTLTKLLRDKLAVGANKDDVMKLLSMQDIPGDDAALSRLADRILREPPDQGYLSVSNALQWRLQYGRVINSEGPIAGIMSYAE